MQNRLLQFLNVLWRSSSGAAEGESTQANPPGSCRCCKTCCGQYADINNTDDQDCVDISSCSLVTNPYRKALPKVFKLNPTGQFTNLGCSDCLALNKQYILYHRSGCLWDTDDVGPCNAAQPSWKVEKVAGVWTATNSAGATYVATADAAEVGCASCEGYYEFIVPFGPGCFTSTNPPSQVGSYGILLPLTLNLSGQCTISSNSKVFLCGCYNCCDSCPASPNFWTFSIDSVTGTHCAGLNNTFILSPGVDGSPCHFESGRCFRACDAAGCVWDGSAPIQTGNLARWHLQVLTDLSARLYLFDSHADLFGHHCLQQKEWTMPAGSWDCDGPNTLTRVGNDTIVFTGNNTPVATCNGLPASITLFGGDAYCAGRKGHRYSQPLNAPQSVDDL